MEPRLSAYAQERREAMGADLELSPAAQRILLAEATRAYRPRAASGPAGWGVFWRRLAWTGAIGAAAAVMLLPMLRHPTPAPKTSQPGLESQAEPRAQAEARAQPEPRTQSLARAVADRPAATPAATPPAVSGRVGSAGGNQPDGNAEMAVMNAFEWRQDGDAIRIQDADGSMYLGGVVRDNARAREAVSQTLAAQAARPASPTIRSSAAAAAPVSVEPLSPTVFFNAVGTNRSLNQKVEIEGQLAMDPAEATLTPGPRPPQAVAVAASENRPTPVMLDPAPRQDANLRSGQGANANHLRFQNTASQAGNSGFQNQRVFSNQANSLMRNAYSNQRIQGQATVGGTNRIVINAVPAE